MSNIRNIQFLQNIFECCAKIILNISSLKRNQIIEFSCQNLDYDQELDFEKSQFCPISRNGENGRFVNWDFLGVIFKHCDRQDPFSINWATLGFPDICSLRIFLLEDMYQMFDLLGTCNFVSTFLQHLYVVYLLFSTLQIQSLEFHQSFDALYYVSKAISKLFHVLMKAEESNWKSSKVCKIGRSAQSGKFIFNVMIFQIQMFKKWYKQDMNSKHDLKFAHFPLV